MNALSIHRGFARNNAWANHRLHAACSLLGPDALHAPRVSFFPTIMKTLNHILIVDWYYLDALTRGGRGLRVLDPEEPFHEMRRLRDAQRAADLRLIELVESLKNEGDFDSRVELQREDRVQIENVGDVLLHLFEHQMHHRGQVHSMLSGSDVPPPQLDEFFLREELPLRQRELEELGLPLV